MEQKRAHNVVFSNHINNEKSAQQVGLGYHEAQNRLNGAKTEEN